MKGFVWLVVVLFILSAAMVLADDPLPGQPGVFRTCESYYINGNSGFIPDGLGCNKQVVEDYFPNIDHTFGVCGSTPDSATGFGAVDLCGVYYPCGAPIDENGNYRFVTQDDIDAGLFAQEDLGLPERDGVCPEDFYANGVRASCRLCPDPDCEAQVHGNVYTVEGIPVAGAQVYAVYEPDIRKSVGNPTISPNDPPDRFSQVDGYYEGHVTSGLIRMYAKYGDFDSTYVWANITRGVDNRVNFTIAQGSCSSDCTGTFGQRCKADCNGINGCEYASGHGFSQTEIANICHERPRGDIAFVTEEGTDQVYVNCCVGTDENLNGVIDEDEAFVVEPRTELGGSTADSSIQDDIRNLVTYVQRVKYRGESLDLVVAYWD